MGHERRRTFERLLDEEDERGRWMRFGADLSTITVLHPFIYGRTLIQLGFEPWPPEFIHSIFGRPILRMPNILQYVGHIYNVDGFYGCFRGLTPALLEMTAVFFTTESMNKMLGERPPSINYKEEHEITYAELDNEFQLLLKRDLKLKIGSTIASYPFHVISMRMMAHFLNRSQIDRGVFATLAEIYEADGVLGFYAGILPHLLYEACFMILSRYIILLLRKYVIKDRLGITISSFFVKCFFEGLFYPLQLISRCMSVNSSMRNVPSIPHYNSTFECWMDLQMRGELRRGNSLFFRTLTQDQIKFRQSGKRSSSAAE